MRNLLLIAGREYMERVRARSFIIMTVLIPGLMFSVTIIPSLMATRMSGGAKHLVVVASDRDLGDMIRAELTRLPDKEKDDPRSAAGRRGLPPPSSLTVDVETDSSASHRAELAKKVNLRQLDGVIFATADALAARKVDFVTLDIASLAQNFGIEQSMESAVFRHLLKGKGMSQQEMDSALAPVHLDVRSPRGEGAPDPQTAFLSVILMVMVLYMAVFFYGISVMRAVLEEKSTRVMEVMLSTATARDMMGGKILGVGAVGLTQVAIWALGALMVSAPGLIGASVLKGLISLKVLLYFPVFFVLGFALYATLCAAIGSMVNSEQETQQLQFLVAAPLIASVVIMINAIQNPGSPLALWGSLFPLTAPLIMFLRIAVQEPPWWHIAISIGLMMATTYGLLVLCGRIYRIGILMYGKKPTLPEILKWIKYA